MRGGVRGVYKLAGDKGIRDFLCQFIGFRDGALHPLGALGEDQLGSVGLHELAALDAHGFGHDNDDAVASCSRHGCKPDAGVAGSRLDDDGALFQKAFRFRIVDHGLGNAVLDGAGGVKIFQFCEDSGFQALGLFNVRQFKQRGFPDQLIGRSIDSRHDESSII